MSVVDRTLTMDEEMAWDSQGISAVIVALLDCGNVEVAEAASMVEELVEKEATQEVATLTGELQKTLTSAVYMLDEALKKSAALRYACINSARLTTIQAVQDAAASGEPQEIFRCKSCSRQIGEHAWLHADALCSVCAAK